MYPKLGATNISMYNFVGSFGFLAIFVYNFAMFRYKRNLLSNSSLFFIEIASKRNKESLFAKTTFWTIIEIFIISCVQYFPSAFFNLKLGSLLKTGANYFGLIYFIPLVLFLFCYIVSINPFKQMDLITPAYPLALIFAKLACFCDGCCGGFECSWGMANYHYSSVPQKEFPTQLVESGLGLAIFIFLILYKKKAKEGTLFPIYLITYSGTRFFSEFTSNDPNVFGILKVYHILCIVGVIVGIIELLIVLKFAGKITPLFDRPIFTRYKQKKNVKKNKKIKK